MVRFLNNFLKKTYHNNPNSTFGKALGKAVQIKHGSWTRLATLKRQRAQRFELYKKFRPIKKTLPIPCRPLAATEIHVLTCHPHVFMCISALKSFLRYFNDLAISIHEDGSLTRTDKKLLHHHLPGVRLIEKKLADEEIERKFLNYPHILKYRSSVINSLELIDHLSSVRTPKIIILNSDVLFLERPNEVIDWIAGNQEGNLCVYEETPEEQNSFISQLGFSAPPHITLGLVCTRSSLMDAELINSMLQSSISFKQWYVGQNILPCLIERAYGVQSIQFLDKQRYQASGEFSNGAVYRHYWTSIDKLRELYFKDGRKVIQDLMKGLAP